MNLSYKNGYIEGVMFCFIKDGKILLEDRGKGFENEAFYPNGKIEVIDKSGESDYILNALYREIQEEFAGQINIEKIDFISELIVPEINVLYYIYIITRWKGIFPDVIKEENELDSNIKFFTIEEVESLFKYDCAFTILDYLKNYISKQKYLKNDYYRK